MAKAGKRRVSIVLDQLRRSHVTPIINQWHLVLVGLSMLRDCKESNVWQNSFLAVNMHPWHRICIEDWLRKIQPFVKAAEKFEDETIDIQALLPTAWRDTPLIRRQNWLKIIREDGPSWDVDLIQKLRTEDMSLELLANIFKIFSAEMRIQVKRTFMPTTPATRRQKKTIQQKSKMIYHVFNPNVAGMTPEQKFQHMLTVRNRTHGPDEGTTVSPYLDVEITPDNQRFLRLKPEDLNMYRVLQV